MSVNSPSPAALQCSLLRPLSRHWVILLVALAGTLTLGRATPATVTNILAEFRALPPNWQEAGSIIDATSEQKKLVAGPGKGLLVCIPGSEPAMREHLFSQWEHGDLDLEVEFLLPPRSNSGLYFQGRYEVQVFDSWGARELKSRDCGGIYERWDPARGKGREGFEGHPPRVNAARRPGEWQTLRVVFVAPRFDATGRKLSPARFVRVELNGQLVQENVDVTGPTRSAAFEDERPLGPLMIQGDHGPVALRRLTVKR